MQTTSQQDSYHGVRVWLGLVLGLILLMVAVGGITRLTESGLSMVTWEPILGVFPPTNDAEWQFRFDQYRAFPEYQQLRKGMTLEEFKVIFFWEYFHRLLGRLLGLAYALPLVYFWWRGALAGPVKIKLLIGLLLGGGQGVMGWYMVKSGLIENPFVSHYRLAAHLSLAFILFGYLLWVMLELYPWQHQPSATSRPVRLAAGAIVVLLVMQMVWGAFVAGLDAGFIYNTFPMMQGYWIAPGWDYLQPLWRNFVRNPVTVQFVHRTLGMFLAMYAILAWFYLRTEASFVGHGRRAFNALCAGILVQVALGILTLIWHVPIALGVMHQVMACLLVGLSVVMLHGIYQGKRRHLHA